uniref:Bulb-type lectin domain-containing protein n=1 Tax=Echeneis naucrates TaxID=173247 RepID=A0A665TBR0_ECHNA
MNKNSISTDEELRPGESLTSLDGNYKAVFQTDGNFVIYKWTPTWASNTYGQNPFRILLQQDNNLVNTKEDKPLWASGELVLDNNGVRIWSAGKKC